MEEGDLTVRRILGSLTALSLLGVFIVAEAMEQELIELLPGFLMMLGCVGCFGIFGEMWELSSVRGKSRGE